MTHLQSIQFSIPFTQLPFQLNNVLLSFIKCRLFNLDVSFVLPNGGKTVCIMIITSEGNTKSSNHND